jgi:putative hemolysin
MKTKLKIILITWCLLLISWCTIKTSEINVDNDVEQNNVWMANPASVYCEENWWTLELIFDNGESYWVCNFQDWSFCEEREFYHGECPINKDQISLDPSTTEIISECVSGTCATNSKTELISQKKEEISAIFDKYKDSNSQEKSWLNEQDIELMEEIIETLK